MAEPSAAEHTAEDVELLATKLMGWKRPEDFEDAMPGCWHDDSGPVAFQFNMGRDPWNPFTSADDDVQVLERVREVWRPALDSRPWEWFREEVRRALRGDHFNYVAGAWSRAALAVLREMEEG